MTKNSKLLIIFIVISILLLAVTSFQQYQIVKLQDTVDGIMQMQDEQMTLNEMTSEAIGKNLNMIKQIVELLDKVY